MKNIIQTLILILLLNACSSHQEKELILIDGNLPKMANQWIYIQELEVNKKNLLDSVQIESDGDFNFLLGVTDPGFYILKTQDDNYALLFLEPENPVTISGPSEYFSDGYDIKGSVDSELLRDFELFMRRQKQQVDSLAFEFNTSKGLKNFLEKKMELDSAYFQIFSSQRDYVIDFIETNPSSMVSLIVLNRKLGNNIILDEEEDFIYFHKLDSTLMAHYPNNKHALDHHKRVEQIRYKKFDRFVADKKLEPGKKAPKIVLKDTSGQFISLKDLAGQKVLIYFWAGWNAKSRQDNRKLIALYPELKENNIEILGVSLDEHKKVWKGAIKLDKTPWVQGSDLMGMNSKMVENYNLLDGLPYYYLVDEEGKIIFRNSNLSAIRNQLDELF